MYLKVRNMKELKKLKTALIMILFGNGFYLLHTYFLQTQSSSFSQFSEGILLGLSVGSNIVGIILLIISIRKIQEDKNV